MLSIVIPTLNAAASLPATLSSLCAGLAAEIIVVDGGSADDTEAVARAHGATVVAA
ncbi:MAG: glycosyltransferase, partial [Proteobacteria bacterium]|nr:glycosyltransferase [Pseudomonadota bacterium]